MRTSKLINVTDYKVLLTINYLNELGYIPSASGVLKILTGVIDEDTEMFSLCPTFQVLVSYNPKRLTRDINSLVTNGYLRRFHKGEFKDYYFEITDMGKATLIYYQGHHKINLKKHEQKKKPTIIKK